MFTPLISQETQGTNVANVCFASSLGLERNEALFIDVLTISLFCFLIGKTDFFF